MGLNFLLYNDGDLGMVGLVGCFAAVSVAFVGKINDWCGNPMCCCEILLGNLGIMMTAKAHCFQVPYYVWLYGLEGINYM